MNFDPNKPKFWPKIDVFDESNKIAYDDAIKSRERGEIAYNKTLLKLTERHTHHICGVLAMQ